MSESGSHRQQLPALRRGIAVLEALARSPEGLGFSQVGRLAGDDAPPSTMVRLLATLGDLGLVTRDGVQRRYRAGPRLRALGRMLAGTPSLADFASPIVRSLADCVGESAACFRWMGDGGELVAKHELPERFHYMPIGGVNRSLTTHGFVRLLVWQLPAADRRRLRLPVRLVGDPPSVLVNQHDDRPGILRIAALAGQGVVVGVTVIGLPGDPGWRRKTADAVSIHAARLAALLEPR